MPRTLTDALLKVTTALPAAAAANFSAGLDLGQVSAFPLNESIEVKLAVPAVPALANTKTLTFTLKDSADNTTFNAIPELSTLVLTGAGGVGAAAASRTVKLPSTARRYIRADAAVEADGGNNTGVSYTLEILN